MSDLRVNRVRSLSGGTVEFVDGVSGNADGLRFAPKIVQYSPLALSTDVQVSTSQFQFTFDQPIKFYGTGTIQIIKSSNSSVYESFAITNGGTAGVGVTIAGNVLQLDTSAGNFEFFTNYHISFPGAGIAGTYNDPLAAQDGYTFRTGTTSFDVDGGDYQQVVVDSNSPTGYYKYNIFTNSGIATFTGPSASATDFAYVLVAGGGGGGGGSGQQQGGGGGAGGHVKDYNASNLPAGNYSISIGAGGPGVFNNPGGTNAPPTSSPTGPWPVLANPGSDSTFGPTPVGTITAKGGGRGGRYAFYGNPGPSYEYPGPQTSTYIFGVPGGSGGGAGFHPVSNPSGGPNNPGGSGFSYPSPNQQGYPGGNNFSPTQPYPTSKAGAGGGGAGGAGGTINSYNAWHLSGGGGGNGAPNPQFPGPGLALLGLPITMTDEMGPSGILAGGGAGDVYMSPGSAYPTNPNFRTPPSVAQGGPGGGGDGRYNQPTYPGQTTRSAQAGFQNMGGGGGCGQLPGGPTGDFPTPAPGTWYGMPGGSGVMMIRFAHPGA